MFFSEIQQPHRVLPPWPLQGMRFPTEIAIENEQRIQNFVQKPKVVIIYFITTFVNQPIFSVFSNFFKTHIERATKKEELLQSLRNLHENVLIPMKSRNQDIDLIIFHPKISKSRTHWIKKDETLHDIKTQLFDSNFKLIELENDENQINEHSFFNYFMFQDQNLKNYDYFMKISPHVQIITPLNWNIFEMFAKYNLFLGYHRWWFDNHNKRKFEEFHKLYNNDYNKENIAYYESDVAREQVAPKSNFKAMETLKTKILNQENPKNPNFPPSDLCYHDYLLLGSFKFFRNSENYLKKSKEAIDLFQKSVPNDEKVENILSEFSSGCWYLQTLAALEPKNVIGKVFHLGQIYLNFFNHKELQFVHDEKKKNENVEPFSPLNGWRPYHDTPMWRLPNQKFPTIQRKYPIIIRRKKT